MKDFSYVITDEMGIHARPAGLLAKEAKKLKSKITLSAKGKSAEATKLMSVMAMGIKCGDTVEICVEGADEDVALEKMRYFFESNF